MDHASSPWPRRWRIAGAATFALAGAAAIVGTVVCATATGYEGFFGLFLLIVALALAGLGWILRGLAVAHEKGDWRLFIEERVAGLAAVVFVIAVIGPILASAGVVGFPLILFPAAILSGYFAAKAWRRARTKPPTG